MARVRVNNQFGFLGADPGISGTTLTFGADDLIVSFLNQNY